MDHLPGPLKPFPFRKLLPGHPTKFSAASMTEEAISILVLQTSLSSISKCNGEFYHQLQFTEQILEFSLPCFHVQQQLLALVDPLLFTIPPISLLSSKTSQPRPGDAGSGGPVAWSKEILQDFLDNIGKVDLSSYQGGENWENWENLGGQPGEISFCRDVQSKSI